MGCADSAMQNPPGWVLAKSEAEEVLLGGIFALLSPPLHTHWPPVPSALSLTWSRLPPG